MNPCDCAMVATITYWRHLLSSSLLHLVGKTAPYASMIRLDAGLCEVSLPEDPYGKPRTDVFSTLLRDLHGI